jgi:hypothetical protein
MAVCLFLLVKQAYFAVTQEVFTGMWYILAEHASEYILQCASQLVYLLLRQ